MDINQNRELLIKAASSIDEFDDWFPLDMLSNELLQFNFDINTTGCTRLLDFILQQPDLFKVKMDIENKRNPKFFVTFIGQPMILENLIEPSNVLIQINHLNKPSSSIYVDSEKVIESIAQNWKLDAKLESSQNYFYHLQEVNSILNKSKYYIIGRKGSGKSSISEYLLSLKNHDTFTEKLSFKNFPFNELYSLDNPQFTPPNQYITLWKYLIYSTVAKLMVQNEHIDSSIRSKLSEIYAPDPIRSLARTISQWTSREFGATVLGTGGSIKLGRNSNSQNSTWIERVNNLEDIILQHCDSSKYFIIFDELDEDYRTIRSTEHELYNFLLTSLFKAVQDIK